MKKNVTITKNCQKGQRFFQKMSFLLVTNYWFVIEICFEQPNERSVYFLSSDKKIEKIRHRDHPLRAIKE